ncbi:polysaccharide deacetylase family protein [Paenibacillus sp. J5C_2022]|uniref:polysaccharide deacetylase family protein n=1 Tax=Paenibacillus sp. J5C2022 TaxID=2977129 RepID=UPI0021CFA6A5|nr:polysaccharide deacetylase family protein [Paenibacillus sp. J5C2022]MCU6711916.1 polysaccharide deacetylase family protein [Paenibacillus sp. J5C2022]
MKVQLNCFPEGKKKALTLSYDDGREHDRQLVAIMNRYGIRGAFHLNSGLLGKPGYVEASEVGELYAGHEISAHTVTHPFLTKCPKEKIVDEIVQDRRELERLASYPVKGMSYPYGDWNGQVVALLPALGIEYARTTKSHGSFNMPADPLEWHPTCHHRDMLECGRRFLDDQPRHSSMSLLYVWGHSYEFHDRHNWDELERFGEMIGGQEGIWYATNIELVLYWKALRNLRFSVSGESVHNPSALSVWFSADEDIVEVKPGQVLQLR